MRGQWKEGKDGMRGHLGVCSPGRLCAKHPSTVRRAYSESLCSKEAASSLMALGNALLDGSGKSPPAWGGEGSLAPAGL